MFKIVGVTFPNSCKTYFFDPKGLTFNMGDGVIVETSKGMEFGTVTKEVQDVEDSEVVQPLKPVIRKATQKDIDKINSFKSKKTSIIESAEKEVEKHGLDMKIVDVEGSFDGSKLTIYYTSPNRIDFRELVKSLAATLKQRIDLRQIGSRDEVKMIGGIAPCGRVCCCKAFLPEFKKVTIKMAKNQGLSLNPAKISGLCGRLMCCLEYENEPYAEAYKKMPKVGSEVTTPDGKATVISNNMLKMLVKTKAVLKDGSLIYNEYPLDKVTFKAKNEVKEDDDIEVVDEE